MNVSLVTLIDSILFIKGMHLPCFLFEKQPWGKGYQRITEDLGFPSKDSDEKDQRVLSQQDLTSLREEEALVQRAQKMSVLYNCFHGGPKYI